MAVLKGEETMTKEKKRAIRADALRNIGVELAAWAITCAVVAGGLALGVWLILSQGVL